MRRSLPLSVVPVLVALPAQERCPDLQYQPDVVDWHVRPGDIGEDPVAPVRFELTTRSL